MKKFAERLAALLRAARDSDVEDAWRFFVGLGLALVVVGMIGVTGFEIWSAGRAVGYNDALHDWVAQ